MSKWLLRGVLAMAVSGGLLLALAGCRTASVSDIQPGMDLLTVEHKLGQPVEVIPGDLVATDITTWIYPDGKVVFQGLTVLKVEPRTAEPTITEKVRQQRETERR